jgi:L-rhamnose mutarotase
MQRYCQVLGVKTDHIAAYERIHAAVWPEVLATITACNIRNYSIFRHGTLLIAYFEYIGHDFEADMARMAADPKTQEWWAVCKPMQEPVPGTGPDGWWKVIPEVFHVD